VSPWLRCASSEQETPTIRKNRIRYYRDQQAWRDLQQYLPQRLRLTDADAPREDFWNWRGHQVHLDRYPNPDAPAEVILHHGVASLEDPGLQQMEDTIAEFVAATTRD